MQNSKLAIPLKAILAISALLASATSAAAQHETVLYSFRAGGHPNGVIFDAAGNLYGTTFSGGDHHAGSVFELSPAVGGGWTETVLHSFDNRDGTRPAAAPVFDADGNLFGTAQSGGEYIEGTVWELKPNISGGWSSKILHSFNFDGTDGIAPRGTLILDDAGNIYGTTAIGGAYNGGIVFELTPMAGGGWSETVLHSFGSGTDGNLPTGGLTVDSSGNLYGMTAGGGTSGYGTVFELTPTVGGPYSEIVLHSFTGGADGIATACTLIFDAFGNLYGTTIAGGTYGGGTLFTLSPNIDGAWNETVLHNFGSSTDGGAPEGPLIFDSVGNLYGTTQRAGSSNDITWGTAYALLRGSWTEVILHRFGFGSNGGGAEPISGMVFDAAGNLYGSANAGGDGGFGTVFEITP